MNINWDAKGYKENFSFVHEYGEDVVSLLKSPKGAAVLDQAVEMEHYGRKI